MCVSLDFNNLLHVFLTLCLLVVEQVHGVTTMDDSNFLDVTKHWCRDSNSVENIYGPISTWNVSQVTSFKRAFSYCHYDLTDEVDFSQWDVKNVTNMYGTFDHVKFNPIVRNWDVSRVRCMTVMFRMSDKFSQDLSGWDVSSVIEMTGMFSRAKIFESNVSNWDVSNVKKSSTRIFRNGTYLLVSNSMVCSWWQSIYLRACAGMDN